MPAGAVQERKYQRANRLTIQASSTPFRPTTSEGSRILVYKDMGLVAQVFDESVLGTLRGHLAIGHTRYSTAGGSFLRNIQPMFADLDQGKRIGGIRTVVGDGGDEQACGDAESDQ